jgi:hypothetical protein
MIAKNALPRLLTQLAPLEAMKAPDGQAAQVKRLMPQQAYTRNITL